MRAALQPVLVTDLFPELRAELERVLDSLTDEQWEYPTVCAGWTVRDVALHLLGTRVGLLSGSRDHDGQWATIDNWQELVAFIDAQNDLWVKAARRISRKLLISLLGFTNDQIITFLNSLDPYALRGPIGWAGDQPDATWLHIARELTEQWAHHQHICDAVGITSLKEARFVHPVLSTYVRALPHTYRTTPAPIDTLVQLVVTGEGGGKWHLVREAQGWVLYADTDLTPSASLTMDADTAWRLFTKGLDAETIRQRADFEGDRALAEVMLDSVAIIG